MVFGRCGSRVFSGIFWFAVTTDECRNFWLWYYSFIRFVGQVRPFSPRGLHFEPSRNTNLGDVWALRSPRFFGQIFWSNDPVRGSERCRPPFAGCCRSMSIFLAVVVMVL